MLDSILQTIGAQPSLPICQMIGVGPDWALCHTHMPGLGPEALCSLCLLGLEALYCLSTVLHT